VITGEVLKSARSADHPLLTGAPPSQAKEFLQIGRFVMVSKTVIRR
jgi:hypothetical protein